MIFMRPKTTYENKKLQSRRIKGKAIVVSNHQDLLDFAANMFTFPTRTMRCAAAEVLYQKNPLLTFFLRALGASKIDRDAHDFTFISRCSEILKKGGVVEIFPESRLPTPDDITPLEFKPSAVYLALETGTPIIPIYNNGKYFKKEPLRIHVGTPIDVAALYDDSLSEKENITNITNIIREKIIEFKENQEKETK